MEAFPQAAWRKAVTAAASSLPTPDYGDPRGELRLRIALCGYLRRARSLYLSPQEIMITNGAASGMDLLARLYLNDKSVIAFEDPGYPLGRQVFAMTGAKILPIPIDNEGMQVEHIAASEENIRLIYTTPSHQFPTGNRMSLQRRKELIEWAQKNNALIVEDDYDSEFRYDVPPLPPIASMSTNGCVAYFGTFSRTLFPALRLGYVVAPPPLISDMIALRTVLDYQTNTINQIALARFIEDGEFEKHILRMRRIYTKKRLVLNEAVKSSDVDWHLCGIDSGINGLIRIRQPFNPENFLRSAEQNDLSVTTAKHYSLATRDYDDSIVLGYSALTAEQITTGVATLASILRKQSTQ